VPSTEDGQSQEHVHVLFMNVDIYMNMYNTQAKVVHVRVHLNLHENKHGHKHGQKHGHEN
jgi:hypothetical protein